MPQNLKFEILISTMNRKDLSFLDAMFPNHKLEDLSVLVINQTTHPIELYSYHQNIRVINATEFGLSKSRNLAIENAKADLVLFADDDVVYLKDFEHIIFEAYQKFPSAALISFQYLNTDGAFNKKYPKQDGFIKPKKLPLSSVEMTANLKLIKKHQIRFNELFGLNAKFPAHEEQLFRRDILKKGLSVAYVAQPILIHPGQTSTHQQGSTDFIKAISAQKYLAYGSFTYLWLIKFVFFLMRKNFVKTSAAIKSYQIGCKAISEIKKAQNED